MSKKTVKAWACPHLDTSRTGDAGVTVGVFTFRAVAPRGVLIPQPEQTTQKILDYVKRHPSFKQITIPLQEFAAAVGLPDDEPDEEEVFEEEEEEEVFEEEEEEEVFEEEDEDEEPEDLRSEDAIPDLDNMEWNDLRSYAKSLGVHVGRKDRETLVDDVLNHLADNG